jgi:hypothetical protein
VTALCLRADAPPTPPRCPVAAADTFVKQREEAAHKRERMREQRRAREAAAAAAEAAGEAAARARGSTRTEERDVRAMLERWTRVTGWAWDPASLLGAGSRAIPVHRALVPVYSDAPAGRRRISAEALEQALQAGLHL